MYVIKYPTENNSPKQHDERSNEYVLAVKFRQIPFSKVKQQQPPPPPPEYGRRRWVIVPCQVSSNFWEVKNVKINDNGDNGQIVIQIM